MQVLEVGVRCHQVPLAAGRRTALLALFPQPYKAARRKAPLLRLLEAEAASTTAVVVLGSLV
jgi:hypothetical protein